ncbi:MAG: hypothetical protein HYU51_11175 [Candidatus Rokubacteria bacterium]|nr:hypothetical protein [Candidatus Rokubacteria bacterium]
MPDLRRAGLVTLLVLAAGGLALALAPFDLGAIRLAGVSLLWWYVGLIAPAVAVALAASGLIARGDGEEVVPGDDGTRRPPGGE